MLASVCSPPQLCQSTAAGWPSQVRVNRAHAQCEPLKGSLAAKRHERWRAWPAGEGTGYVRSDAIYKVLAIVRQ
jgi:hypothetical protein